MKSILFNNACVITFVFFSLVLTFLFISSKEFQGSLLFFLHCLVFKMLFSVSLSFSEAALLLYHSFFNLSSTFFKFFQIIFSAARYRSSELQLLYYITTLFICQPLFRSFFKYFFELFSCPFAFAPLQPFLLYHFRSGLSSTFFFSFLVNFCKLSFRSPEPLTL